MLQLAFSTASKAIYFYQGGITTYNLGQKTRHLYIDPIFATDCNCVSEKTVSEMAINVCRLFSSDWGIAVTGYASPVPESDNKLFAWWALAYHGQIVVMQKLDLLNGNPFDVQLAYSNKILSGFHQFLQKEKTPRNKSVKKAKGSKEQ
jgi:PncC family amidohydrolase